MQTECIQVPESEFLETGGSELYIPIAPEEATEKLVKPQAGAKTLAKRARREARMLGGMNARGMRKLAATLTTTAVSRKQKKKERRPNTSERVALSSVPQLDATL